MPVLALPAIVAIIAALMALLILYGGRYIGRLVANLMPDWGIPGLGNIRGAVSGAVDVAIAVLEGLLDDVVSPLAKLITYPITMLARLYDAIISTITSLHDISAWIITRAIPGALAAAKTWAAQRIAAAVTQLTAAITAVRDYATALYHRALTYVDAQIAALHHLLGEAIATAVTVLRTEIAAARTFAAGLVSDLRKYVDALVNRAVATLSASIAAVDAFARAAYRDTLGRIADAVSKLEADIVLAADAAVIKAVTEVETAVTVGLGDVWGDVVDGIDGAIDAAGDGFDWVRTELGKIDLSKVADLAGLASITGISIGVLTRYMRECGMPNCRNLSGLGRDLQALLGMVEGVALFELIRELVHNHDGAAHELADTLGGLAEATIRDARGLVGV